MEVLSHLVCSHGLFRFSSVIVGMYAEDAAHTCGNWEGYLHCLAVKSFIIVTRITSEHPCKRLPGIAAGKVATGLVAEKGPCKYCSSSCRSFATFACTCHGISGKLRMPPSAVSQLVCGANG